MRPVPLLLVAAVAAIALEDRSAAAQPLVTDMSQNVISITSSFTGAEILLFGSLEEPGDVIVVVQGPREEVVVRRKGRVAGIWMNQRSVAFQGVPAYYAVASSEPLDALLPIAVRARYRMGGEFLDFSLSADAGPIAGRELLEFRRAIVRNKQDENLYFASPDGIRFRDSLFRTSLVFPANAPEGEYTVDTYLVRDRMVVDQHSSKLIVSKAGLERAIFDLATEQPALYGVVAIAIALAAGWIAAVAFRRT